MLLLFHQDARYEIQISGVVSMSLMLCTIPISVLSRLHTQNPFMWTVLKYFIQKNKKKKKKKKLGSFYIQLLMRVGKACIGFYLSLLSIVFFSCLKFAQNYSFLPIILCLQKPHLLSNQFTVLISKWKTYYYFLVIAVIVCRLLDPYQSLPAPFFLFLWPCFPVTTITKKTITEKIYRNSTQGM